MNRLTMRSSQRLAAGHLLSILALLSLAPLSTSCSVKPDFVREEFNTADFGPISVLPIIDARADPDPAHDFTALSSGLQQKWVDRLKKTGYEAEPAPDVGTVNAVSFAELSDHDQEWVKTLGPSGARWVLAIAVTDLRSERGLFRGASAAATGYLFNKETGELWWQKSNEQSEHVFILGYLIVWPFLWRSYEETILANTVRGHLMLSFPKRP